MMAALLADLATESDELFGLLDGADPATATPAVGWSIRDQVTHLAYFDAAAVRAATDPAGFRAQAGELIAAGPNLPETVAARLRDGSDAVAWLRRERARLLATFAGLDPGPRLPWFGPPMSVASALTARLMETWAHGQDVADALGVRRRPTGRLRHVAHLGVRTFAWSFQVHGRAVPDAPVRVELDAPGGGVWTWGPPAVPDRVTGPAEDFGLVVTQRRHRDDTALRAAGRVAVEWLRIAQAFAGPPGAGRPPGAAAAMAAR